MNKRRRIVLSTTSCGGRMVGTIWYELIQMYLLYMTYMRRMSDKKVHVFRYNYILYYF